MKAKLIVVLVMLRTVSYAGEEASKPAPTGQESKEAKQVVARGWPFDAKDAKRRQEHHKKGLIIFRYPLHNKGSGLLNSSCQIPIKLRPVFVPQAFSIFWPYVSFKSLT